MQQTVCQYPTILNWVWCERGRLGFLGLQNNAGQHSSCNASKTLYQRQQLQQSNGTWACHRSLGQGPSSKVQTIYEAQLTLESFFMDAFLSTSWRNPSLFDSENVIATELMLTGVMRWIDAEVILLDICPEPNGRVADSRLVHELGGLIVSKEKCTKIYFKTALCEWRSS